MPSARRADRHAGPEATRRRAALNGRLARAFPELRAALDGLAALWDGEALGPHAVYAGLLVRQLLLGPALEPGGGALLRRAARFLEGIVDGPAEDLARFGVLENLLLEGGPEAYARLLEVAGPRTRRVAREVAASWGVPLARIPAVAREAGAGGSVR